MSSLSGVLSAFTKYAVKADKDCGGVIMYRGLPSKEGRFQRSVLSSKILEGRGVRVSKLAEMLYTRDLDVYGRPRRSLKTTKAYLDNDLKYTYEAVMALKLQRGEVASYNGPDRKKAGNAGYFRDWGTTMRMSQWKELFDFPTVLEALVARYPDERDRNREQDRLNKIMHISSILHLFFQLEVEGKTKGYDDFISSVLARRSADDDFEPPPMTAAQKKNYVPWNTIVTQAKKALTSRRLGTAEKLMLALYTLMPPRRKTSLHTLRVAKGEGGWRKVQANITMSLTRLPLKNKDDLFNWLWIGGGRVRIVLLDYKTAAAFGPFVYELGKGLHALYRNMGRAFQPVEPAPAAYRLNKRKFYSGQKERDKLIQQQVVKHLNTKRTGQRVFPGDLTLQKILKRITKKNIDTRLLRHIYVTHLFQKDLVPFVEDREVIGRYLGHNARQLEKYAFRLEEAEFIK